MNIGSTSGMPASVSTYGGMQKDMFGAQLVTKTLDTLHSDMFGGGGMSQTYDFAKDVLSAATVGQKGSVFDMNI